MAIFTMYFQKAVHDILNKNSLAAKNEGQSEAALFDIKEGQEC